jgi:hypothetical protein
MMTSTGGYLKKGDNDNNFDDVNYIRMRNFAGLLIEVSQQSKVIFMGTIGFKSTGTGLTTASIVIVSDPFDITAPTCHITPIAIRSDMMWKKNREIVFNDFFLRTVVVQMVNTGRMSLFRLPKAVLCSHIRQHVQQKGMPQDPNHDRISDGEV